MAETVWVRKWDEKSGRYTDPVPCLATSVFAVTAKNYTVCGPKGTNPEDFAANGARRGDMDGLDDDGDLLMAGTVSELGDVPPPQDAAAAHVVAQQPAPPPPAAVTGKVTPQDDIEDDDESEDDELVTGDDDMDVPPAPGIVASPVVGQPKGKAAKKKLPAGEL